jgi:hypothetical protein
MADDISITIDTVALDKALAELPLKVSKRYMRKALKVAGDIILASTVALAPERTDETTPGGRSLPPGILKRDLCSKVTVTENFAGVKIGPTEIAGHVCKWQNNGWELTTHGRRKSRKKIRQIPGKHFMEAGADEASAKAVDAFVQSLAQALQAPTGDAEE